MLRVAVLLGTIAGCDVPFGVTHFPDAMPDGTPDAVDTYESAVLADQPLAYFRLDETSGVTLADRVVGGPTGQIVGNVTFGQPGAIAGDTDAAFGFDGTNSAIDVGNMFGFEGNATFSIECWIQPSIFDGAFHAALSKWTPPSSYSGWDLYTQDAYINMTRERSDLGMANQAGASVLAVGMYTHVVGTYDGIILRLYINGVQQASTPSSLAITPVPVDMMIGAGNGEAGYTNFAGLIDEVAIYDHALAPDRVFDHFHIGTTAP